MNSLFKSRIKLSMRFKLVAIDCWSNILYVHQQGALLEKNYKSE